jgi:glycosyltransferase involved in cell wall biosynthesis
MRILYICIVDDPFDPPGVGRFGGGHYFALDLIRHLVRQGEDITVATRRNRREKPAYQYVCGSLRVHRLLVGNASDISTDDVGDLLDDLRSALFKGMANQIFDTVHSQHWISGALGLAWANEKGGVHVHMPITLGRQQRPEVRGTSQQRVRRDVWEVNVFRAANWIVVASPYERDALIHAYHEVDFNIVVIIPCGIDTDVFYPRPGDTNNYLRRQAGSIGEGP